MSVFIQTLLRMLPWLLTTFSANLIHYRSLLNARQQAHRHFLETAAAAGTSRKYFPGSSVDEHELLTFDLMQSRVMRKARYKIKAVHCLSTLIFIALFYQILPELRPGEFSPGLGTLEAVVVGLLSGLITVFLDENREGDMRTLWNPGMDHESGLLGCLWDGVRVLDAVTSPFETCLFYHSWLYRALVLQSTADGDEHFASFLDLPFTKWNWSAYLSCNCAFALYNGKEWRSSLFAGLVALWVMGRRGQFLDGVLALSVCRMTVNAWVVFTGERQFW